MRKISTKSKKPVLKSPNAINTRIATTIAFNSLQNLLLKELEENELLREENEAKKKQLEQDAKNRLEEDRKTALNKQENNKILNNNENPVLDQKKTNNSTSTNNTSANTSTNDANKDIDLSLVNKESLFEGGNIGLGNILAKRLPKTKPVKTYSRNQLKENSIDLINAEAKKYNDDIDKLISLKDSLVKLKNEELSKANAAYGLGNYALGFIGQRMVSRKYDKQIKQLDDQIKELQSQKSKDRDILTKLTDPDAIYKYSVNKIMTESDVFKEAQAKVDNAAANAKDLKDKIKFENGFISFNTDERQAYRNATLKFENALIEQNKVREKLEGLQDWLNTVQYLPNSVEEIPSQYRNIAKKVFIKDGKDLLKDKTYRDNFYKELIVYKDQFKQINQGAREAAKLPSVAYDENFINDRIQYMQYLKDAEKERLDKDPNYALNTINKTTILGTGEGDLHDKIISNYDSTIDLLKTALDHKRLEKLVYEDNYKSDSFIKDIDNGLIAFQEFFGKRHGDVKWNDPKTYKDIGINQDTFGYNYASLKNASNVYKAAQKLNDGEKLNLSEESLLQANFIENMYAGEYGHYNDVDAFKWSKIAAESLKFMAEFIATRGVLSGAEATASAGSRAVSVGVSKAMRKVALNAVEKYGKNRAILKLSEGLLKFSRSTGIGWGRNVIDATSRVTADAMYSAWLTNTLGLDKTMTDAYVGATGKINGHISDLGGVVIDGIDRNDEKSFGLSLWISEKRNWIENFSEMMGEFGLGKLVFKGATKIPKLGKLFSDVESSLNRNAAKEIQQMTENYLKHGITKMNGIFAGSGIGKYIPSASKIFNKNVLKAGQFHGLFGEVAEEYYGIILQHMMNVLDRKDMGLLEDMKAQSADIWGGITLSTALLGAWSVGSSIRHQVQYNNAEKQLQEAFGKEQADKIRRSLIFADNADISAVVARLGMAHINDAKKTKALDNYYTKLIGLRGAVYGEELVNKNVNSYRNRIKKEAYEKGYSVGDYRMLKSAQYVANHLKEELQQTLKQHFGEDVDVDKYIEDHDGDIVEAVNDVQSLIDSKVSGFHEGKDAKGRTVFFPEDKDGNVDFTIAKTEDGNYVDTGLQNDVALGNTESDTSIGGVIRKLDDIKQSLLAYYNAKNYAEGIDDSVTDTYETRISKMLGNVERLRNRESGAIKILTGPKDINEDGVETPSNDHLYLIDGTILTKPGSSQIEDEHRNYSNKEGKVLVANKSGNYFYIDVKDLKGWNISSEELNIEELQQKIKTELIDQEWKTRDNYLKELKFNSKPGEKMTVGDKIITILDAVPGKGITYSLSNEDGSDAKIYQSTNEEEFDQFIDSVNKESHRDITQFFKDDAARIIQSTQQEEIAYRLRLALEAELKAAEEAQSKQEELEKEEEKEEETPENDNTTENVETENDNTPEEENNEKDSTKKSIRDRISSVSSNLYNVKDKLKNIFGISKVKFQWGERHKFKKLRVLLCENTEGHDGTDYGFPHLRVGDKVLNTDIRRSVGNRFLGYNYVTIEGFYKCKDRIGEDHTFAYAKYRVHNKSMEDYDVCFPIYWENYVDPTFLNDIVPTIPSGSTIIDYTSPLDLKLFMDKDYYLSMYSDEHRLYETFFYNGFIYARRVGEGYFNVITGEIENFVAPSTLEYEMGEEEIFELYQLWKNYYNANKLKIEPEHITTEQVSGPLVRISPVILEEGLKEKEKEEKPNGGGSKWINFNLGDTVYIKHLGEGTIVGKQVHEDKVVLLVLLKGDSSPMSLDSKTDIEDCISNTPFITETVDENDQKDALIKLKTAIGNALSAKMTTASGFHYFIMEDGRPRLHRRAHSILPDRMSETRGKLKIRDYREKYESRIRKAYEDDGLAGIKDIVQTILNEEDGPLHRSLKGNKTEYFKDLYTKYYNTLLNTESYYDYLEKYPEESEEVIIALASILSLEISPTVMPGNVFDTICRVQLDSEQTERVDFNDTRLKVSFFGKDLHIGETFSYELRSGNMKETQIMLPEAYEDIIDQILKIKEYYENVLKWKLCTTPFTLHGKFIVDGKEMYIAGETDCIGVDQQGHYHIIDFKTYKHNSISKRFYPIEGDESNHFFDRATPGELDNKRYFKNEDLIMTSLQLKIDNNAILFSNAAQYTSQVCLYEMMAFNLNCPMVSAETLMLGIDYTSEHKFLLFKQPRKMALLVPKLDENNKDTGELIPNRIVLDQAGQQHLDEGVRQALETLRSRIKQITDSEFINKFNSLNTLSFNISEEDKAKLSYSTIARINDLEQRRKDLINAYNNATTDEDKSNFIHDVDAFVSEYTSLSNTAEEELENARKLQDELNERKKKLSTMFSKVTSSDIRNQLDQCLLDLIFLIEQFKDDTQRINIDDIDNDDLNQIIDGAVKLDLFIEYVNQVNPLLLEDDKFIKALKYLNLVLKNIIEKLGGTSEYSKQMQASFEGINESDIENVETEEKPKWYLVNGLVDKMSAAGEKTVLKSHAVNDDALKLKDAIELRDFIKTAKFYIQQDTTYDKSSPRFEMVIVYNDVEYTPVIINTGHNGRSATEEGEKLYDLLKKEIIDGKKTRIKIKNESMSRTFGLIENHKKSGTLEDEFVEVDVENLVGKNIYDIEYSASQLDFCLTRLVNVDGSPKIVAQVPGRLVIDRRQIKYVYSGNNTQSRPSNGVVVMLYKPQYQEIIDDPEKAEQKVVPINLNMLKFDTNTAQLVADILMGKYCKDENASLMEILKEPFYQNGQSYPFTNRLVMLFFISYGNHNVKGDKEHVHINVDSNGLVHIQGRVQGQGLLDEEGNAQSIDQIYDLNSATGHDDIGGYNQFVSFLCDNVRMQVNEEFMYSRFDEDTIYKNRQDIAEWFENTGSKEMTFGKSPINFSIDDITNFPSKGKKPISGLGWYIRNGMLKTAFKKLSTPLIAIDVKDPIDTNPEVIEVPQGPLGGTPPASGFVTLTPEQLRLATQSGMFGLPKTLNNNIREDQLGTINKEEAERRIREILGDIKIDWKDGFLNMAGDSRVIGRCYYSMIQLSYKAVRGVEYHEAFHMVLELLTSEKQRAKIYSLYRNKYKKNNNGKILSDREIAENIADEFWYFKDNNKIKLSWNIKEVFKSILDWIKFFRTIGSFELYRFYRSAANGKYRNVKPTEEAIARFKKFAEAPYLNAEYKKNGTTFKYILNDREFNAVKRCISKIAVSPSTFEAVQQHFDYTGVNTGKTKITSKMILNAPDTLALLINPNIDDDAKRKFACVMGIKIDDNGVAVQNLDGSFVLENNNLDLILEEVMDDLKQYGLIPETAYNRDLEEKKTENEPTDEDNVDEIGKEEEDRTDGKMSYGEFTKESAEFAPIDRATRRVKLFFSFIPATENKFINTPHGPKLISYPVYNEARLPENMPFAITWARALNKLYGVRSQQELLERLRQGSETDSMMKELYNRYYGLVKKAYVLDEFGNPKMNSNDVWEEIKDHDAASSCIEIASVICHARIVPFVAQSIQKDNNSEEAGSVKIQSTDQDYLSRDFRYTWSAAIASGETKYIGRTQSGDYYIKLPYGVNTLEGCAEWFVKFSNIFSRVQNVVNTSANDVVKIEIDIADTVERNGKLIYNGNRITGTFKGSKGTNKIDINNPVHLLELKKQFVSRLNDFGIGVSIEDFDAMLLMYYGGVDKTAMQDFFEDVGPTISKQFKDTIIKLGEDIDDTYYSRFIGDVWSNKPNTASGWLVLISRLAEGRYKRISEDFQTRALTINGKAVYLFGENNFITDRLDEILKDESETRENLIHDPFYFLQKTTSTGEENHGSIVLKELLKDVLNRPKLEFISMPGFKTDIAGSIGIEYLKMSEQEDYVSKFALLATNAIILSTLSDKTTYGAILGIKAFGIDFTQNLSLDKDTSKGNDALQKARDYIKDAYRYNVQNGKLHVSIPNDILNQFIEYAECEYVSARRELERYSKLKPEEKVFHYHKGGYKGKGVECNDGHHDIIQGARLSTLTGIYDENDNFISFNKVADADGNWVSEETNLELAEKLFFKKTADEKRKIMERLLSRQVLKQVDKLVSLGLVEKIDDGTYRNVGLDRTKVLRMLWLLGGSDNKPSYKEKGRENSDATIAYITDMTMKALMSNQEILRLYAGNLAYYEWKYGKNEAKDTVVRDTTTDFFKRLGGLVSTGSHSVADVPGISKKIGCAEIYNEKIVSPMAEDYHTRALEQELKNSLRREMMNNLSDPINISNVSDRHDDRDRINKEIDDLTLDETKDKLILILYEGKIRSFEDDGITITEDLKRLLYAESLGIEKTIENKVETQYDALNGVDVNDGATYITDDYCEMLLLSLGKLSAENREALKILRNATSITDENMLTIAENYNKIYTTVVGTLKYTAFGQRPVEVKREDGTSYTVNETYYDKTAFFPIFSCMASGHMKAVLQKMKEDDVHVLKVFSATKEGNKGAVKLDEDIFSLWDDEENGKENFKNFHFNRYEQEFSEMRKQFNTDPKEKEFMSLGTQYVKVVMSLITADQIYDVNGVQMDATQIRDTIMQAFNKITEYGLKKHNKRFYGDEEGNGDLNVEELLSLLRKQLSDKEANDPLIQAFLVVDELDVEGNTTGKKQFKLPIAALSSSTWIESIVASTINKLIVDINTPGAAFYQRSAWGMEGRIKTDVLSLDQVEFTINHGARLKEENEEGSMDCVLSIDYFDYLFNAHPALKYQSFEVKKNWLIKNGIISGFHKEAETFEIKKGDVYIDPKSKSVVEIEENDSRIGDTITAIKWHNAVANIVGYRIPTQAVSSIHALRCVDIIPAVRDTIILPKEITAVTGSDYDIDKFFLSTLFYKSTIPQDVLDLIDSIVSEAGFAEEKELRSAYKKYNKEHDDQSGNPYTKSMRQIEELKRKGIRLNPEYEEDSREYWANRLLQLQISLLKTTGNNLSKLHGSIDADTQILTKAAEAIQNKLTKEEYDPFDSMSLITNITSKMSFAIGKSGIGPFALNNNNHVFTMLYGVKFVSEKITDKSGILDMLDLRDLSKSADRNGDSILSIISGLINAHVDVAKDPYIRSLGVNGYTYNLVNLLIRTGYGKETFWFTTQPIMLKLYDAYDLASGVYRLDESLSKYTRIENEILKTFVKYVNDAFGTSAVTKDQAVNEVIKNFKSRGITFVSAIKAVMKYKKGVDAMREISTTPDEKLEGKTWDLGLEEELSLKDIQCVVGIAHFMLQQKAQNLSDLVQCTKIDTKKQGKTVIEQRAYREKLNTMLDKHKSPFEYKGISRMINDSFIGPKTNTAINAMEKILSTLLYLATKGFKRVLADVVGEHGLNSDRKDANFMTAVTKMIVSKIKADYFFKGADSYCIKRGIDPVKIMSGPLSIFARLNKIKNGVLDPSNDQYSSIRGTDGLCNNYLINNLILDRVLDIMSMYSTTLEIPGQNGFIEDQWQNAAFVKYQNIFDDNVKSTDMVLAWLDLLNDSNHPELQQFAEDLVVYAFMTSADNGGKFDLFKFVPPQWATGECEALYPMSRKDTYAEYHNLTLKKYTENDSSILMSDDEIRELILSWHFDDDIIRTLSRGRITSMECFVGSDSDKTPLIIGAIRDIFDDCPSEGFSADSHPGFFKIPIDSSRNSSIWQGQRKWNVYQKIGMAKHKTDNGDIYYPIYGLVQPCGGKYGNGQRIFAYGLPHTTNEGIESAFKLMWQSIIYGLNKSSKSGNQYVPNFDKLQDITDLFNLLVYMKNATGLNFSFDKVMTTIDDTFLQKSTLYELVKDRYAAIESNGDEALEYEQLLDQRDIDSFDYDSEATDLHLENIIPEDLDTSRYTPMKLEDATNFKQEDIDKVKKKGVHVEFYEKRFIGSDDKEHYSLAITLSLENRKAKGFFEIVSEADLSTGKPTGRYFVHFKTYSAKAKNESLYAVSPMSEGNKLLLKRCLVRLIPDGGKLTTVGTVSKGGMHAIDTLDSVFNKFTGGLLLVDDVNTVISAETGEEVNISVWQRALNIITEDQKLEYKLKFSTNAKFKKDFSEAFLDAAKEIKLLYGDNHSMSAFISSNYNEIFDKLLKDRKEEFFLPLVFSEGDLKVFSVNGLGSVGSITASFLDEKLSNDIRLRMLSLYAYEESSSKCKFFNN